MNEIFCLRRDSVTDNFAEAKFPQLTSFVRYKLLTSLRSSNPRSEAKQLASLLSANKNGTQKGAHFVLAARLGFEPSSKNVLCCNEFAIENS